ncbi:MAG TPA: PIN domain nuclease [Stellaceae bacterium]|nr:PIN domain nuclease [Stellaceae bacterium]
MILVDSSVWIDLLNNVVTEPVTRLRQLIPSSPILIGDLILCEVLQGLRTEAQAKLVERSLGRFEPVSLLDPALAVKTAANYRFLCRQGITVRKTIDLMIGTFCVERGHSLLHSDRDFAPMEHFLGLQTV